MMKKNEEIMKSTERILMSIPLQASSELASSHSDLGVRSWLREEGVRWGVVELWTTHFLCLTDVPSSRREDAADGLLAASYCSLPSSHWLHQQHPFSLADYVRFPWDCSGWRTELWLMPPVMRVSKCWNYRFLLFPSSLASLIELLFKDIPE